MSKDGGMRQVGLSQFSVQGLQPVLHTLVVPCLYVLSSFWGRREASVTVVIKELPRDHWGLLCLKKGQDQREGSQRNFLEEVAYGMQSWVDASKGQKAFMKRAGAENHMVGP